jgi:hypothetical protein
MGNWGNFYGVDSSSDENNYFRESLGSTAVKSSDQ